MAIKLKTDLGNTGLSGDHWAMCDLQIHVGRTAGTTDVIARYAMWASAEAKAAGKAPLRRGKRTRVTVEGTDPRLSEIEAACDVVLTAKTIQAQPAVRAEPARSASKSKAAVKARSGVEADPDNGIKAQMALTAQPAVAARRAMKAIKARRPTRRVQGGDLEDGTIV